MSSDMENRMENNFLASENEREQLFNRIAELEQRVKVLTDAVSMAEKYLAERVANSGIIGRTIVLPALREVLKAAPQQTAAQIERGHVEWMMKLPVEGFIKDFVPLVAIPPLPKDEDSPETDLE